MPLLKSNIPADFLYPSSSLFFAPAQPPIFRHRLRRRYSCSYAAPPSQWKVLKLVGSIARFPERRIFSIAGEGFLARDQSRDTALAGLLPTYRGYMPVCTPARWRNRVRGSNKKIGGGSPGLAGRAAPEDREDRFHSCGGVRAAPCLPHPASKPVAPATPRVAQGIVTFGQDAARGLVREAHRARSGTAGCSSVMSLCDGLRFRFVRSDRMT